MEEIHVFWRKHILEERAEERGKIPEGQSLKKITNIGCVRDVECRLGPG
jgi:hypothetical protein